MNVLRRVSEELATKVVLLAVAKERQPVLRAVSQLMAREEPPTKVAWAQVPPLVLRAAVLRAGYADAQVAQVLAAAWLHHSPSLRATVWQALHAHGYVAAGPPPNQPVEPVRRLRPADRHAVPHDDDPGRAHHYFYPAGQPLLAGQQDEAVALMAHLLGWSALAEVEEALPTDPAQPLPGDDDPALLALEAGFSQLSEAEIAAIPPRESELLLARSRQRALQTMQRIVAQHHAGTYPTPRTPPSEDSLTSGANLQEYADELADSLTEAAEQLRRGELPVSLVAEVGELEFIHTLFEAVYIKIASYAGPVLLPVREGRTVATLHQLADDARRASSGAALRDAALHQLSRLAEMRHRTLPDFAPLAEIQAQGHVLATEIAAATAASLPATALALHAGNHPFATLLHLVGDADALDQVDEQSATFQALEEALPRALVTALLLRKLELPAATAATEAPAAEATRAEPASNAAPAAMATTLPDAAPSPALASPPPAAEAAPEADAAEVAWLPPVQWQLLAESRPALAWHLTRAAHPPAGPLPARLLHALLLGPALLHPAGALSKALSPDFQPLLPEAELGSRPHPLATRLLEVAAALRPALLAPATGAAAWLLADIPALPALNGLLRLVASRDSSLPLRPERGFSPLPQADWQLRMEALRTTLTTWETSARAARYRQQVAHPATLFWQYLLRPEQPAGQLMDHLRARGPATAALLATVQMAITQLQAEPVIINHMQQAQLELSDGHPAWEWLRGQLNGLVDLAGRWDYLRAIQPGRGSLSQLEAQDKALCQKLATALPAARQELAALRPLADEQLSAALPWAEAALAHLHALLHQPAPAGPEPTATALTHAPLLPYATLPLDLDGRLPEPAAAWLPALREAAAAPEPGWAEAYAAHLSQGQHQATARILALPGAGIGASDEVVAQLHETRATALQAQQSAATDRLTALRQALELATRRGWLAVARRTELLHQHAQLRNQEWEHNTADFQDLDYAAWHRELDDMEAALHAAETAAETAADGPAPPGFGPANAPFAAFFPSQLRLLEQELESHPLPELLGRLAQGGTVAGCALQTTSPEARAAASQALYAWEELRGERTGRSPQALAEAELLLRFLGFENVFLSPVEPVFQGPEVADFRTRPLADGARCPVPHYGSEAGGRYRLVLVWRKVAEAAQLLDDARLGAAEAGTGRPTLLFYFNSLSENQRHDLAAHSRQRRQTVLVLDRLLLVHLATAGLLAPQRLPLFFQLALPFAWLEPFPGAAPELFVGRLAEQQRLMAPELRSPGLLLGPARSGKTALLNQLVARYHQPDTGQLVLLLNAARLGPPEHLLATLERELKRLLLPHGIVPAGMAATLAFPKVLRYVRTWLRAAPGRRLVLLLDNATPFIEQGLVRTPSFGNALVELTQETDASFKLVLACPEWSPAIEPHEAVRLGALLDPADAGAAETLLRRPLESLGVVFEDEVSVSEVLDEAGYFPAAVQLLGQRLLAHLYAQPLPAAGERPAYRLGRADVHQVLREATSALLAPSLELASTSPHHLLAFRLLSFAPIQEQYAGAPGRGLLLSELEDAARHYYPTGFAGPYAFTTAHYALLLDQMTNAGITLRTADGRYFLTESHWHKAGTPAEMRTQLDDFDAYQAAEMAEDIAAGLLPAPVAPALPKVSMLKRLTNGRRRL